MTGDPEAIAERLRVVSYYRLSAYWYPFRASEGEQFKPGTDFERVWEAYAFDRQLRLLAMDAIERIEIAVRTRLVYHHVQRFGPFGYATKPDSLPNLLDDRRTKFFSSLADEVGRSRETFVKHYKSKYGDEHHLPLWMATEIMSFGATLTLFNGCDSQAKRAVAEVFAVDPKVLASWLLSLNTVRNICAHHGRLWNRESGTAPMIPAKQPAWNQPYRLESRRIFAILTIANYCLEKISPGTGWASRWRALLEEHPRIHRRSMGVPVNWLESSLWASARTSAGRSS